MMHLTRSKRPFAASVLSVCLVVGLFVDGPCAVAATGDVQDFSIHQHGQTPRALGMGNAFVGVADDFGAMFYNPAGLARLPEGQTHLELIHAGLDTKFPGFFNDIDRVSKTNNISEMVQLLESNYGNHFSARIGALNAYLVRPRWGLALIPVDLTRVASGSIGRSATASCCASRYDFGLCAWMEHRCRWWKAFNGGDRESHLSRLF